MWLAQMAGHRLRLMHHVLRTDLYLVMLAAKVFRRLSCQIRIDIELRIRHMMAETRSKTFEHAGRILFAHRRQDDGRVETAGQKNTDRPIGHKLAPDGIVNNRLKTSCGVSVVPLERRGRNGDER